MSIRNNLNVMNSLITAKDTEGLEKFLAYCDLKDQMLRSYIASYGSGDLQSISKQFKAKALQQRIEIICE